jgi:hypothetical protein
MNSARTKKRAPRSPDIEDHPLRGHEPELLEECLIRAVTAGMPREVELAHRQAYGLPQRLTTKQRLRRQQTAQGHRDPIAAPAPQSGWPPALVAATQDRVGRGQVAEEAPTQCLDEFQPTPRRKHTRTQANRGDNLESAGPRGLPILGEREVLHLLHLVRFDPR